MKNILKSFLGILILVVLNESANAFCSISKPCCVSSKLGNEQSLSEHIVRTFPNPACSIAMTSFTLDKAQFVNMQLVDVNGRVALSIADKYFEVGKNKIEWNVSNVDPGIYFLQIQTQELIKTEKLVVAKQ